MSRMTVHRRAGLYRDIWRLCLFALAATTVALLSQARTNRLPAAPQVRAKNHVVDLTLRAVRDAAGHDHFSFNGQPTAPVIRVSPGDTLKVTYVNDLPRPSGEQCSVGPCHNMTNLHFHGLSVSPMAPQDDVLEMMAMPGETLHYSVAIPTDQPPGLYWYHTHPHGESEQQALDGMSSAIIVEGIDRYIPELRALPEKVLVLRGQSIEHDPQAAELTRLVNMSPHDCGQAADGPERIFTVNGAIRPKINIAPGERQFWRIVNAAADRYVDLQIDGSAWEVVAMDGMPLAYHDPQNPRRVEDHVLLPPASRLEAIVTGPASGKPATLHTRCVDTGPDGDPTPAAVVADLSPQSAPTHETVTAVSADGPAIYRPLELQSLESTEPRFVATFTEDKAGFYINGQKYSPDADPMVRVHVGTLQHWRVVNNTRELHPMHLHQVHFLVYAQNGSRLEHPEWRDTVSVPYGGGTVDMIVDFTNPVIRGVSVFHCHLLNHEDKGMMAKILFE
jgi:suppressor of ftsI